MAIVNLSFPRKQQPNFCDSFSVIKDIWLPPSKKICGGTLPLSCSPNVCRLQENCSRVSFGRCYLMSCQLCSGFSLLRSFSWLWTRAWGVAHGRCVSCLATWTENWHPAKSFTMAISCATETSSGLFQQALSFIQRNECGTAFRFMAHRFTEETFFQFRSLQTWCYCLVCYQDLTTFRLVVVPAQPCMVSALGIILSLPFTSIRKKLRSGASGLFVSTTILRCSLTCGGRISRWCRCCVSLFMQGDLVVSYTPVTRVR